jgi:cytochrome c-type biogenesis protein CcmF
VALWLAGVRHTQVLLTFILGSFTMTTVVMEFHKGTRARATIEGEGFVRAFGSLIQKNRRRYGGYIVHAGLVIMFMGFAGAAYDVEKQVTLTPGESTVITSPFGHEYRLTYQDMSWYTATNMTKIVASLRVEAERAGRPGCSPRNTAGTGSDRRPPQRSAFVGPGTRIST